MQLPTSFFGWVAFLLDKYGALFLKGTGMTLLISLTGTVIGFAIGLVVATLRTIPTHRRTPTPLKNCLRSLANHTVVGLGLYLTALVIALISR